MTRFPVQPKLKQYRGSNARLQRKNHEFNTVAHRAAAHLNRLVANNDSENQQYMFADIAYDIEASVDDVRSAISDGGYNGRTFMGITEEERKALVHYKQSPTGDL